MSRIGKLPVLLEQGIKAQKNTNNEVLLQKGNQSLSVSVHSDIEVQITDSQIVLVRKNDNKQTRAFHGLYRALLQNAKIGLTKGWQKSLKFNGVGYKANVSDDQLELNLGYSHPISFKIPKGIEVKVEKNTTVHIHGSDRQKVSQVAAQIRGLRPPEPYLGKGVRYMDEVIRKKSGKSGAEKKG